MNIALISPSKNVYSETFIQAHKELLKANIFHYYNGEVPTELEGGIIINSRRKRIIDIFKGHYRLNRFSLAEQAVITSFKKNKIELVFAEYGPTGQLLLPVCKELELPLIVHFHGYDASAKNVLKTSNNYQDLFEYARYIVAVSRKMYKDLLDMGCPESKLVYNVCGPREEFQKVQPKFSKPQFIAIGRFTNKKAPYYLILSFKEVVTQHPEAKLVVAGEGELWNVCKNLIKFYDLENNVSLPGIITKEQFLAYLSESVAMVQHSITAEDGDTEGTPVSILEASAAGLPVISTKHAGIPDVIIHGETGLLVEENDVNAMGENMIKILGNIDLAKKMGAKGKINIKENFNIFKHISLLDQLIEESVKSNY